MTKNSLGAVYSEESHEAKAVNPNTITFLCRQDAVVRAAPRGAEPYLHREGECC